MGEKEDRDSSFMQKFKRRKVSAIRSFPPGCGLNSSVFKSVKNDDAKVRLNIEDKILTFKKILDGGLDAKNATFSEGCAEAVSAHPVMDTISVNADIPDNVKSEIVEGSKTSDNGEVHKVLENAGVDALDIPLAESCGGLAKLSPSEITESSRLLNNLNSTACVETAACEGDTSAKGITELKNMENLSTTNSAVAITRKFPYRRRMSAVRDFPRLCGDLNPKIYNKQIPKSSDDASKNDAANVECPTQGKNIGGETSTTGTCGEGGGKKILEEAELCTVQVKEDFVAETVRDANTRSGIEVQGGDTLHPSSSHKIATSEASKFSDSTSSQLESFIPSSLTVKSEEAGKEVPMAIAKEDVSESGDLQSNFIKGNVPDSDVPVVQGLMAALFCPWKSGGKRGRKVVHHPSRPPLVKPVKTEAKQRRNVTQAKKASPRNEIVAYGIGSQTLEGGTDDSNDTGAEVGSNAHHSENGRKTLNVNPPPLRVAYSGDDGVNMRLKVRETLRLFQAVSRKLIHEEESKSKGGKIPFKRFDLQAAKILKDKGRYVNAGNKIIGPVPGVEVGDEFQYRVELAIIGVHHVLQGGIDFVERHNLRLATSVVASGGYADEMENPDILVYTGSGGIGTGENKEPMDQKLERGNLALKNSVHERNPVRVVRGYKELKNSDVKPKIVSMTYTYDGLYVVEKFWQEIGQHGKLVFKFQLNRIPGQPLLAWREVKNSVKSVREGLCMEDISQGKELMRISAVNTVDEQKPPLFTYTTRVVYPEGHKHPLLPAGCECVGECSDSAKCSCAARNGGELPYNNNGAIVEAKFLVFECGTSCRCSKTCTNRVSQHGIQFQLEVFKTQLSGWGVRSLNSIPSGSFICEYTGEILEEKEAEMRMGNDEYLFDIGNNLTDHSLWKGLDGLVEPDVKCGPSGEDAIVEYAGFTIDAALFGSVGRFINHSCSPNLYAQNVLYDHHDKRMPHVMLFAAENIPPLQELTYHYNYNIDQVHDSDGNIKMKRCFCGTTECTGRMY